MSSSVGNLQLLNNTEHRVKFKTGSDINNVLDPIVGEIFLENPNNHSLSCDGSSYMGSEPIERLDGQTWSTTTPVSQSAWVKSNSFTVNDGVFGIGKYNNDGSFNPSFVGGNGGIHQGVENGQNKYYLLLSGTQHYLTGNFDAGVWYHIAWTWDGNNGVIYVNGVENTTFTDTSNGYSTRFSVWAGGGGRWSGYADCLVDELAVWDSALSAIDVNFIYQNKPTSMASLSPLAWYRMEEGTDIQDASGNSKTGKLFGATFSRDTPHPPALYTCTDKSGTISKITDLTERMGDVPMLKLNQNQLTAEKVSSFGLNGTFAYSVWFYDDGSSSLAQHDLIQHNESSPSCLMRINHVQSTITLFAHGNFDFTCSPTTHGSNCPNSFIDPSILIDGTGNNPVIKYEKNKLNNLVFVRTSGTISGLQHNTGSAWIYLNGKLIGSIIEAAYHTYPSGGFIKFNHNNNISEVLIGDVAFWNQDVTGIIDEILDPRGGHKGQQGNYMDVSIQPYHYWRFGAPMASGEIEDIGTDGTNNFTPNAGITNGYEYKNIFGIDRSAEF